MSEPIISVTNIGKKYKINHEKGRYIALRDVIATVMKKPFSFLKHKAKSAMGMEKREEFWALRGVNFTVEKGEVIGVIGPNGAGKSTLLKIISQITPPTEGEIILNGRVGSLLEVGTGFHPELTGRENIFLNGAILGMTRREIAQKFDQIVEFAGINKFIDTPVKYYSSGMYVRLAFSVAAHMEPDILIVDEVLAVGDAEFQKKCLGKMEEVTREDGRTIIFVSHNLDAIRRLCSKTVLLERGKVIKVGNTADVIDFYLNANLTLNAVMEYPINTKLIEDQITKITILGNDNQPKAKIPVSENFSIEVEVDVRQKTNRKGLFIHFNYQGELLLFSGQADSTGKYPEYDVGKYKIRVEIPAYLFQIGMTFLVISFKNMSEVKGVANEIHNVSFEITNEHNPKTSIHGNDYWGKISTVLPYKVSKIQ